LLWRRPPLTGSSERIALANAFADFGSFFETHVLAIERACALRTDKATFAVGKRREGGTPHVGRVLRRVGEPRTATATGAPNSSNDCAISIEREVDVDPDAFQEDPSHSWDSGVVGTDAWKGRDQFERAIQV
jgi:hypothetical protein